MMLHYSALDISSGVLSQGVVKLKFHYADFATKSRTSSLQSRGLVADTNHESPRHKSRRWLLGFVSRCRHVEMVCVRDLRDLRRRRSPKLHGFMICHRLCPRLFPWGSFGESRRNGIWALHSCHLTHENQNICTAALDTRCKQIFFQW